MKKITLQIIILFASLSSPLSGLDLARIRVRIHVSYADKDTQFTCSFRDTREFFFTADVENGIATYATLHPTFTPFSPWFFFYKAELPLLTFYQEKNSRMWLKGMTFIPDHLLWLLHNASQWNKCRPPHDKPGPFPYYDDPFIVDPPYLLESLSDSAYSFQFEHDGIEIGVYKSHSNEVAFQGTRKDGSKFEGKISFRQERP